MSLGGDNGKAGGRGATSSASHGVTLGLNPVPAPLEQLWNLPLNSRELKKTKKHRAVSGFITPIPSGNALVQGSTEHPQLGTDPSGPSEGAAAMPQQDPQCLWSTFHLISGSSRAHRTLGSLSFAGNGDLRSCQDQPGLCRSAAVPAPGQDLPRFPRRCPRSASSCHQRSAPGSGFRSPMTLLIPARQKPSEQPQRCSRPGPLSLSLGWSHRAAAQHRERGWSHRGRCWGRQQSTGRLKGGVAPGMGILCGFLGSFAAPGPAPSPLEPPREDGMAPGSRSRNNPMSTSDTPQ